MEKGSDCDVRRVTSLIRNYIPDIETASNAGSELSYKLDGSYSRTFERMLGELENGMGSLDVKGYGVTLTTLEDVFIKYVNDLIFTSNFIEYDFLLE